MSSGADIIKKLRASVQQRETRLTSGTAVVVPQIVDDYATKTLADAEKLRALLAERNKKKTLAPQKQPIIPISVATTKEEKPLPPVIIDEYAREAERKLEEFKLMLKKRSESTIPPPKATVDIPITVPPKADVIPISAVTTPVKPKPTPSRVRSPEPKKITSVIPSINTHKLLRQWMDDAPNLSSSITFTLDSAITTWMACKVDISTTMRTLWETSIIENLTWAYATRVARFARDVLRGFIKDHNVHDILLMCQTLLLASYYSVADFMEGTSKEITSLLAKCMIANREQSKNDQVNLDALVELTVATCSIFSISLNKEDTVTGASIQIKALLEAKYNELEDIWNEDVEQANILVEEFGLKFIIKKSSISGAGLGLFFGQDTLPLKKNQRLSSYKGQLFDTPDTWNRGMLLDGGAYAFVNASNTVCIDAFSAKYHGYARFANDPRGRDPTVGHGSSSGIVANAKIDFNDKLHGCFLMTLDKRSFKKGQEIFVDYGEDYWKKRDIKLGKPLFTPLDESVQLFTEDVYNNATEFRKCYSEIKGDFLQVMKITNMARGGLLSHLKIREYDAKDIRSKLSRDVISRLAITNKFNEAAFGDLMSQIVGDDFARSQLFSALGSPPLGCMIFIFTELVFALSVVLALITKKPQTQRTTRTTIRDTQSTDFAVFVAAMTHALSSNMGYILSEKKESWMTKIERHTLVGQFRDSISRMSKIITLFDLGILLITEETIHVPIEVHSSSSEEEDSDEESYILVAEDEEDIEEEDEFSGKEEIAKFESTVETINLKNELKEIDKWKPTIGYLPLGDADISTIKQAYQSTDDLAQHPKIFRRDKNLSEYEDTSLVDGDMRRLAAAGDKNASTLWLTNTLIDYYCRLIMNSSKTSGYYVAPQTYHDTILSWHRDLLESTDEAHKDNWSVVAKNLAKLRENLARTVTLMEKENRRCDKLIIVINDNGNHWFICVIHCNKRNTDEQKIVYLDPLAPHVDKKKYDPIIKEFCQTFLRIDVGTKTSIDTTAPKQNNTDDCGVYSCMYIRCLTTGYPFAFSQKDITNIRRRIALDIHLDNTLHTFPLDSVDGLIQKTKHLRKFSERHFEVLQPGSRKRNDTYGEISGIHICSMIQLLADESVFGILSMDSNSHFLDIGSGMGRVVMQAKIQTGIPKSSGFDISETWVQQSNEMQKNFAVQFPYCDLSGVTFNERDLKTFTITDHTHIYCFNLAFEKKLNVILFTKVSASNFSVFVCTSTKDEIKKIMNGKMPFALVRKLDVALTTEPIQHCSLYFYVKEGTEIVKEKTGIRVKSGREKRSLLRARKKKKEIGIKLASTEYKDYLKTRGTKQEPIVVEKKYETQEKSAEGRKVDNLVIRYIDDGKGRRLFTGKAFKQKEFITYYTGEVINEGNNKKQYALNHDPRWTLASTSGFQLIDGNPQLGKNGIPKNGGLGSLMNTYDSGHATDVNVSIDIDHDTDDPASAVPLRFIVTAKRDLKKGEELIMEYGFGFENTVNLFEEAQALSKKLDKKDEWKSFREYDDKKKDEASKAASSFGGARKSESLHSSVISISVVIDPIELMEESNNTEYPEVSYRADFYLSRTLSSDPSVITHSIPNPTTPTQLVVDMPLAQREQSKWQHATIGCRIYAYIHPVNEITGEAIEEKFGLDYVGDCFVPLQQLMQAPITREISNNSFQFERSHVRRGSITATLVKSDLDTSKLTGQYSDEQLEETEQLAKDVVSRYTNAYTGSRITIKQGEEYLKNKHTPRFPNTTISNTPSSMFVLNIPIGEHATNAAATWRRCLSILLDCYNLTEGDFIQATNLVTGSSTTDGATMHGLMKIVGEAASLVSIVSDYKQDMRLGESCETFEEGFERLLDCEDSAKRAYSILQILKTGKHNYHSDVTECAKSLISTYSVAMISGDSVVGAARDSDSSSTNESFARQGASSTSNHITHVFGALIPTQRLAAIIKRSGQTPDANLVQGTGPSGPVVVIEGTGFTEPVQIDSTNIAKDKEAYRTWARDTYSEQKKIIEKYHNEIPQFSFQDNSYLRQVGHDMNDIQTKTSYSKFYVKVVHLWTADLQNVPVTDLLFCERVADERWTYGVYFSDLLHDSKSTELVETFRYSRKEWDALTPVLGQVYPAYFEPPSIKPPSVLFSVGQTTASASPTGSGVAALASQNVTVAFSNRVPSASEISGIQTMSNNIIKTNFCNIKGVRLVHFEILDKMDFVALLFYK